MKPEELHIPYDSPIEISFADELIGNMSKELAEHIDEQTFKAVLHAGFFIDRKKMVEALTQDKERYADAYRRGYMKREEDIIRCKDCRFRDDAVARASVTQWMPCEECRPYDEWYCAYGERKDGDVE